MTCEIILLSMVQYAALNDTLSCQCWNVKRIWWRNPGTNNIQTGAAEMGKFWRYFAGSWSRHSSTLRRQHAVVGRQWQGIPSSLAAHCSAGWLTEERGCYLCSYRFLTWQSERGLYFGQWKYPFSHIFVHREQTCKDNRKQQALPSIFFL